MSNTIPGYSTTSDPEVILGSFSLESKLGVGSYATAYLATQQGTDRKSVIKIAHPHLLEGPHGEAIHKRFEVELRASTRVRHPNVVTVYTSGVLPDGRPAIAMEYVEGHSFETWLEEHAPLSTKSFNSIFHQLANALQALHDAGIVHRDLSPRNMIINEQGTNSLPHVTLLDFGIAQLDGATHVTVGPIGTPQFMAPEQLRGETTKASDIFVLGQLMWWAMTGNPLFDGFNTQMEIFKFLSDMTEPPILARTVNQYSPDIVQAMRRILSPDPLKRPSADEVAAILSIHTDLSGDSAEWFPAGPATTGQFKAPQKASLFVLTHPDVPSLLHDSVLPFELCDVTSAPQEQWEHHRASLSACDIVCIPIPTDGAQSRQVVNTVARFTESLPTPPKILVYRTGSALRGAWGSLGATDVVCFPQDGDRLIEHIKSAIKANAKKSAVHVAAPETFNPGPLRRSLNENFGGAQDLIETFIGHMPEWLLELEEQLEDDDRAGVRHTAGLISSHARRIGAERVVDLCHKLCHVRTTYDTLQSTHWVEELEREYMKLFQELIAVRRR